MRPRAERRKEWRATRPKLLPPNTSRNERLTLLAVHDEAVKAGAIPTGERVLKTQAWRESWTGRSWS